MPPKRIREMIGRSGVSLETLVQMADGFGVSKEAIGRAFVDAYRDPVAVVVSRNDRVERFYRSEDFPFLPIAKSQLLPPDCLSADFAEPGIYSEIEEIDPEVWFSDREAEQVLCLCEQVLWQNRGYRLTLLLAELDEIE